MSSINNNQQIKEKEQQKKEQKKEQLNNENLCYKKKFKIINSRELEQMQKDLEQKNKKLNYPNQPIEQQNQTDIKQQNNIVFPQPIIKKKKNYIDLDIFRRKNNINIRNVSAAKRPTIHNFNFINNKYFIPKSKNIFDNQNILNNTEQIESLINDKKLYMDYNNLIATIFKEQLIDNEKQYKSILNNSSINNLFFFTNIIKHPYYNFTDIFSEISNKILLYYNELKDYVINYPNNTEKDLNVINDIITYIFLCKHLLYEYNNKIIEQKTNKLLNYLYLLINERYNKSLYFEKLIEHICNNNI